MILQRAALSLTRVFTQPINKIQGDHSRCCLAFVDIKTKVEFQHMFLVLTRNFFVLISTTPREQPDWLPCTKTSLSVDEDIRGRAAPRALMMTVPRCCRRVYTRYYWPTSQPQPTTSFSPSSPPLPSAVSGVPLGPSGLQVDRFPNIRNCEL